jgi:hypothetical protein
LALPSPPPAKFTFAEEGTGNKENNDNDYEDDDVGRSEYVSSVTEHVSHLVPPLLTMMTDELNRKRKRHRR